MEMTLLLLLCVGSYAQEVPETLVDNNPQPNTTSQLTLTPIRSSESLVLEKETSNLNSVTSSFPLTRDPEENGSARNRITWNLPPSTPHPGTEEAAPGASTDVGTDHPAPVSATPQETSAQSTEFLEISKSTSNTAVSIATTNSLDPHSVADEVMVTTFLPTVGTSGPLVTMTTNTLEPTDGASGPPVTTATHSPDTFSGTSERLVTMTTSSVDTSSETSGSLVTITTSSLGTSSETSGSLVTMTSSSEETSKGITDSPTSRVKMPLVTSKTSLDINRSTSQDSYLGTKGSLLVPVLVALLVVLVLVALLLLWRRRQNRRTGVLTLNVGGKRNTNGVVDAWAGPVPMSDEEAMTATAGAAGDDKSSGEPEGEGPGRRPTLTTFFGRRKSRQGSLALEELKAGSPSALKGEVEPLVDSEEEAMEAPTSDRPEAGEAEASEGLND